MDELQSIQGKVSVVVARPVMVNPDTGSHKALNHNESYVRLKIELPHNVDSPESWSLKLDGLIRNAILEANLPLTMEPVIRHAVGKSIKEAIRVEQESALSSHSQPQPIPAVKGDIASNGTTSNNMNSHEDSGVFAMAFCSLLKTEVFDTLMQLEQNYANVLSERLKQHEEALAELQQRHASDLDRFSSNLGSSNNISRLVEKHLEEMELFKATCESEMHGLYQFQKREYHEFVIKTNEGYSSSVEPRPASPEPEVTNEEKTARMSVSSGNHTELPVIDTHLRDLVQEIQDMGFSAQRAEIALELAKMDKEQAIYLLLENPARIDKHLKWKELNNTGNSHFDRSWLPRSTSNSHLSNSKTLKKSRSGSLLAWNMTPRHPSNPPVNGSGAAGRTLTKSRSSMSLTSNGSETETFGNSRKFSPLNFIQQQQASLSGSNSPSLKRVSSILGKAMEVLSIDSIAEPEPMRFSEHSETFTAYFGTQVKTMYNLRLWVPESLQDIVCIDDPTLRMALRAQTATTVYSANLSGLILLLSPDEWTNYGTARSCNPAFMRECRTSTEFHFEDIQTQLNKISAVKGDVKFNEGDFFVTRHSNLPMIHVAFHMLLAEDAYGDLNSQSLLIRCFRDVVKLALESDVNDLSFPLLLLPLEDPFAGTAGVGRKQQKQASLNPQAYLRRVEVVLKNLKGVLNELSWSQKHSMDSVGVDRQARSFQFLLPPWALTSSGSISGSHNDEIGVWFDQFRQLVSNIFRVE